VTVRTVGVYRGRRLVLTVEDRPGLLLSTASPPPDGAPEHPFVNARALDPYSEGELGAALEAADSYDGFLANLIAGGFDVAARTDDEIADAHRIVDGDLVLGCVWDAPGPVATLGEPPESGWPTSAHVTLTAYVPDRAERILHLARDADGVAGFLQGIWADGLELREVADR
jgi:hypothetical protein